MVKLKENKIYTEHQAIEILPLPKRVYIPLIQHIGKPASPKVKIGDEVLVGQQIAVADAAISSPIHASVSGKVTAIGNWPHPTVGMYKAIAIDVSIPLTINPERSRRIDNDNKDSLAYVNNPAGDEIKRLSPDEIRKKISQAGIVGMGGAGFPAYAKLKPTKPVDSFILNCAECEPYSTGDYRLMVERTNEILKGTDLVVRCLGVNKVFIAIEDNKPEAISAFRRALKALKAEDYTLHILKSYYPQGGEGQLIKNILKREIPSGKLPFHVGVLVHNVGTVFAMYEAIYKNKPLYERVVTVTGDCLEEPKNLLVRIGTPIKDLIEFCQLKNNPAKIVIGGPMMGIAQYSEMVPIIKTSTAVILLSDKQAPIYKEDPCIRCGECVRNCPVGMQPCMISLAVERKNWELAKSYSPLDCIECGLCAYLCPAKRNLVQSIKYVKMEAQ